MLIIVENTTVVEQSKAYQVVKIICQIVYVLEFENKVFQVVFGV